MKRFYLLILAASLWCSAAQANSPYEAARTGDLEALRQYRFEGIDLYNPDERGFIPYELAALHANPDNDSEIERHVEMMLWLKEFNAEKHRYGTATTALIQAGLNALGYDAGTPDGVMGEHTAKAIRSYQRDNDLAETGRPGPQWLGFLYQDSVKDMQYKLSKLGYASLGTDGVMGPGTRQAMLKYRRDNQLDSPDYPHLDGLLLASIDTEFKQKEKEKQQAVKEKEREKNQRRTRYAQAGLRALGYRIGKVDGMSGSKTSNAIKAFQRKNDLTPTGEVDEKTRKAMRKAFAKDTQKKLNALGYRLGTPDGLLGKRSIKAIRDYRIKQGMEAMGGINADMLQSLQGDYVRAESERQEREEQRKKSEEQQRKKEAKQRAEKLSTSGKRIRFAQAGMRTLGYGTKVDGHTGGKTEAGIKRFQKRYKLKVTGKVDDKTFKKMKTIFLKETQRKLNALGYKTGKPDGKLGVGTVQAIKKFRRKHGMSGRNLTRLIVAVDDAYDNRNKKKSKRSTKPSGSKPEKKSVSASIKQKSTPKKYVSSMRAAPAPRINRRSSAGGRSASGRMIFNRSGGRVVGCSIAGRYIPIEWCEPFYPLPRNNRCKATFKSNGAVINLLCR